MTGASLRPPERRRVYSGTDCSHDSRPFRYEAGMIGDEA